MNRNIDAIHIGLEAAVIERHYMEFGWAHPGSSSNFYCKADVMVAGFTDQGDPFADDYYITKYTECVLDKDGPPSRVFPYFIYVDRDGNVDVNNMKLVYS